MKGKMMEKRDDLTDEQMMMAQAKILKIFE